MEEKQKKKYKNLFRIAPSRGKNVYSVLRRRFSSGFEEIAVVTVVPGRSYQIDAKKHIKSGDLEYLNDYFKKKANLSGNTISETV